MAVNDVVTIGKLVLAAVALGAVIATGAPALTKLLIRLVGKWLGRILSNPACSARLSHVRRLSGRGAARKRVRAPIGVPGEESLHR